MGTNIAELKSRQGLAASQFGQNDLAAFFGAHKKQIQSVLPRHMTPERLLRVSVNAINSTPQLLECSVESLLGAVIQSSILGLEPNTPLGQAYLVPFWNSKKKCKEVQLIPGYKGLIDLARRSGQIKSLSAHEVCANDEFEFEYGLNETLVHKPAWQGERGDVIGYYAVAHFVGGGHVFEVMSQDEVNKIRDGSQGYQAAVKYKFSSPWMTNPIPMGRKTVVRRLANYLPMSIEISDALALDNTAAAGQSQGFENVLDGTFHVVDAQPQGATPPEAADDDPPIPAGTDAQEAQAAQLNAQGYYAEKGENGTRYFNIHGEIWNQEIHATSTEGLPVINSDGHYRARRGVNPAQVKAAQAAQPSSEGSSATTESAPQEAGGESNYSLD